jgi:hypothetical protein
MAHKVSFRIPYRDLGKADVEFDVKNNNVRFGKLKISKGSLVWFPKGKTKGHKCYWGEFDEFMTGKRKRETR